MSGLQHTHTHTWLAYLKGCLFAFVATCRSLLNGWHMMHSPYVGPARNILCEQGGCVRCICATIHFYYLSPWPVMLSMCDYDAYKLGAIYDSKRCTKHSAQISKHCNCCFASSQSKGQAHISHYLLWCLIVFSSDRFLCCSRGAYVERS